MSSSDVACAAPWCYYRGNPARFLSCRFGVPLVERCVDPEYEVRHSGIAVRAAERWSATLSGL
jgi:hypothetical protein